MTIDPLPTGLDTRAANGSRLLLAEHHRDVEAACTALVACACAGDPHELVAQYRNFEHAVLEHLAAEEELILPAYAVHAPSDGQAIRDDHAELRRMLYRIAVDVELHVVRATTVDRLVAALREHAAHEDATMYPWAQEHLSLRDKRKLFVRIVRSLRALARFQKRRPQVMESQPRA